MRTISKIHFHVMFIIYFSFVRSHSYIFFLLCERFKWHKIKLHTWNALTWNFLFCSRRKYERKKHNLIRYYIESFYRIEKEKNDRLLAADLEWRFPCSFFFYSNETKPQQNKHQHKFQVLSCPMFYLQATLVERKKSVIHITFEIRNSHS